jgi:hypothetical protein
LRGTFQALRKANFCCDLRNIHQARKPVLELVLSKSTLQAATPQTKDLALSRPQFWSDREFLVIVGLLTAIYFTAIYFSVQRFVWFDELCTLDIARVPSDPTLEESKGVPRVSYPTPYVAGGSPYLAKHVFLVIMPTR